VGILYCDGERFRKALVAGANWLSQNSETLNQLNVFPVPDGDTGTNMSLTLIAAVDELKGMEGAPLDEVLEAAARGTLMGARGCSGVILSQIIAGFAEVAHGKNRFNPQDIVDGFAIGTKRAYQAVTEPREGTILTVLSDAADEASQCVAANGDMIQMMEKTLDRAKKSLENTPNLLPVLAQAGVVDSGGQGLVCILEGILRLVRGESLEIAKAKAEQPSEAAQAKVEQSWETPYCTEFVLTARNTDIPEIREKLSKHGTDLVVVGWGDLLRVHIHTGDPEKALAIAHFYGKPGNVKIDDMRKQHTHIVQAPVMTEQIEKETMLVIVAAGDGISAIFKSLGADIVVMSDQRNPSVAELIQAIDSAYSDKIIMLPNDGNIIPAAIQAANMRPGKQVRILPSRNVSQGFSAIIAFRQDGNLEDNVDDMTLAMKSVKHGEIAQAIRDSQYMNLMINKGDIIGKFDGKICVAEKDIEKALLGLLRIMNQEHNELITIFYGSEISRNEAEAILAGVEDEFGDREIELHYGGQPHCYYILSVE